MILFQLDQQNSMHTHSYSIWIYKLALLWQYMSDMHNTSMIKEVVFVHY